MYNVTLLINYHLRPPGLQGIEYLGPHSGTANRFFLTAEEVDGDRKL